MARARIPPEAAGQRMDHAVAAAVPGLSVAAARRLLVAGAVRVDGRLPRKGAKIGAGEAGAAPEIDGTAPAGPDRSTPPTIAADPHAAGALIFQDAAAVAVAET